MAQTLQPISSPFQPAATVHGTTVVGRSTTLPLAFRTPDAQWDYGVSFESARTEGPMDVPITAAGVIGIRVTVVVSAGRIGIGCLNARTSAFIDEVCIDAAPAPATVELLAAAPAETGALMIRNASSEGASIATILDVRCFDVWEPPDAQPERSLLRPPVVPHWARYYGARGDTLIEKLRVRHFERLDGPATLAWSDGLRLRILPREQLSRATYVSGTYEPNTLRVLRALLSPGDVFFDVGANVGVVSLAAACWVGPEGRVCSFEPSEREFGRLIEHLSLNGATNVTASRVAVAARPGEQTLRVADACHGGLNTLGSRFPYDGVDTARLERIETITLDDFVARERIDRVAVMKLDIEGGEGGALEGSASLLRTHRPALVVEIFSRALEANGWRVPMVEQLLHDARYVCFAIDDATGRLQRADRLTAVDEQNIVALPAERADADVFGGP